MVVVSQNPAPLHKVYKDDMVIFEINVGSIHTCRSIQYVDHGHECFLFESNPQQYVVFKNMLHTYSNVHVFNYDINSLTEHPLMIRDIDPGNIDILYIKKENELIDILDGLISKPLKIHIPDHCSTIVMDWANNNHYRYETGGVLVLAREIDRPTKQKDTIEAIRIHEQNKPIVSSIEHTKPVKNSVVSLLIQRVCGLWR